MDANVIPILWIKINPEAWSISGIFCQVLEAGGGRAGFHSTTIALMSLLPCSRLRPLSAGGQLREGCRTPLPQVEKSQSKPIQRPTLREPTPLPAAFPGWLRASPRCTCWWLAHGAFTGQRKSAAPFRPWLPRLCSQCLHFSPGYQFISNRLFRMAYSWKISDSM